MHAMLNWYRASPIDVPSPGEAAGDSFLLSLPDEAVAVRMPHLVVWGEADEALRPCVWKAGPLCSGLDIRKIPGAGHWILHEKPAEVADAIRLFLGETLGRNEPFSRLVLPVWVLCQSFIFTAEYVTDARWTDVLPCVGLKFSIAGRRFRSAVNCARRSRPRRNQKA